MFELYTNKNLSSFQESCLEEVIWSYVDYYTIGNGSDQDISYITKITCDDKEISAKEIDRINRQAEEKIFEWRRLSGLEAFAF